MLECLWHKSHIEWHVAIVAVFQLRGILAVTWRHLYQTYHKRIQYAIEHNDSKYEWMVFQGHKLRLRQLPIRAHPQLALRRHRTIAPNMA